MWLKIEQTFPALSNHQFRLFFGAKAVSDIGTWMQRVVQGFIVYEMTGSAVWVGAIDALQTVPSLFFVFAGGVMLDSFDRKKVLKYTQLAQFIIAGLTGLLLVFGLLTVHILAVCALLFGIADAINQPARTLLAPLLVPRELIRSAMSLGSTVFNIARIVGPMFAGITIAMGNPGLAYIANALSFLPLVFILHKVHFPPETLEKEPPLTALIESFKYVYGEARLLGCLLQFGIFGIFGWCYMTILPVIAKDTLFLDATGLSTLYTAIGIGAVVSGLWVASAYMHTNSTKRLLWGPLIFAGALTLFAFTTNYHVALIFLAVVGFGQILQNATLQTQIQLLAPEMMRGRVSSIQAFLTQGTRTIGAFGIGVMTEYSSSAMALFVCALIIAISAYIIHERYLVNTHVVAPQR